MFRNFKLKYSTWLVVLLLLVSLIGLAIFANDGFSANRCAKIIVTVKNADENAFVKKEDVEQLATNNGSEPLVGKLFEKISFSSIEKRVLENKQIKTCQVHKDLRGNLNIEIEQYIPIARILMDGVSNDMYIDETGKLFPISKHYTARVPIISGAFVKNINALKNTKNQDLLQFINHIKEDPFWSVQFTQLDIDENKSIVIVPLMGNHLIEFGQPSEIDAKLNKLKTFYKQILPVKGWDTYTKISVKFANQIVCE